MWKKTVKNEKVSMIIFCVNKIPYHFLSLNYWILIFCILSR